MWLSEYFGWIPLFNNTTATTAGQFGKSLLIAGIVLAIMIIPIVSAVCREVFLQVPAGDHRRRLGAGRHQVGDDPHRGAAVRPGRHHLRVDARAWAGRSARPSRSPWCSTPASPINWHITEPGGDTFASTIALKFGEAGGNTGGIAALIAAGLFLFVITLVVNSIARLVIARKKEFTA